MKLNFLNNPQQRIATGKRMPTKPLECVLIYGSAEQKMRSIKKMIPVAFSLSQHQETAKLISTLLKYGGNTARCEFLFSIRRQLITLSRSKVGNYVMQELVACVPRIQQKEIAREFQEELLMHCQHQFSHRVIIKMMSLFTARDELEEKLKENVQSLSEHTYGQHVISAWLENSEDACEYVVDHLDVEACITAEALGGESTVVCSLLSCDFTPLATKQEILEVVVDNLEELHAHKQHHFLVRTALQHGSASDKDKIAAFYLDDAARTAEVFDDKALVAILIAIVKYGTEGHRTKLMKALGPLHDAAQNPTRTMVLRALIERGAAAKTSAKDVNYRTLLSSVPRLASSAVSSPVLQLLLQYGSDELRVAIATAAKGDLAGLTTDPTGSYLIQSVLEHGSKASAATKVVNSIAASVLNLNHFVSTITTAPGTRVVQKALSFCTDDQLVDIANVFLEHDGGIKELALDCHAAYTLKALLLAIHARCPELIETRRAIMGALKPVVFSLALSPWAGRIVLDTMLEVASQELGQAIRNVIYLKAENWLSEVPVLTPPSRSGGAGGGDEKKESRKTGRNPDTAHLTSTSSVKGGKRSGSAPKKKQRV